jgi:hypothetical protein
MTNSGIAVLLAILFANILFSIAIAKVLNASSKHMCTSSEHVDGEWIERVELANGTKSFVCSLNAHMTQNDYFYHDGTMGYEYSGGCVCDEKQGWHTVNKKERYEWVPDNCTLAPWDAKDFCRVLGNRTIFLTGDSTMHQTATTLMSMIHHNNGTCAHQVKYGLSHYLIIGGGANIQWTYYLLNHKPLPDIVIMTVGAHLEDMGDLYSIWEVGGDGLKSNIKWLRSHPFGPHNFTFVWKTQNPGHVNCTQHTDPLKTPQVIQKNDPNDAFHWNIHREFDEVNKKYAKELGMPVIDMSPLYYRADAHPSTNHLLIHKAASFDCLHYCLPGPLNLFSILLYNKLLTGEI